MTDYFDRLSKLKGVLADNLDTLIYYSGSNAEYVCQAAPGTSESDHKWQIKKLQYDGSGNVTRVKFANGKPDFRFRPSLRAGYTYIGI